MIIQITAEQFCRECILPFRLEHLFCWILHYSYYTYNFTTTISQILERIIYVYMNGRIVWYRERKIINFTPFYFLTINSLKKKPRGVHYPRLLEYFVYAL